MGSDSNRFAVCLANRFALQEHGNEGCRKRISRTDRIGNLDTRRSDIGTAAVGQQNQTALRALGIDDTV